MVQMMLKLPGLVMVMALVFIFASMCTAAGWIETPDFNKSVSVGLLYIAGVVTAIWAKVGNSND
jgi:hypothetical protein